MNEIEALKVKALIRAARQVLEVTANVALPQGHAAYFARLNLYEALADMEERVSNPD